MKFFNFKTKEDIRKYVNENTEGKWQGNLILINEALQENYYIRWTQNACTWFDGEISTTFDKVIDIIYKNRKTINKYEF